MDTVTDKEPLLSAALMMKLERLSIAVKRSQLGVTKGERKSKRKGQSVEFADYRDYVQGDDLRHVDWNLYARLDNLYLKLFQEQEDLTLHLLIDASKSMAFGTPHKFLFAQRLAAAIGYIGLTAYDRVSAAALSDGVLTSLAPLRGRVSARRLFAFLEGIEAQGGTQLAPACRAHVVRNRTKGVALFISDFFDETGFEEGLRQLAASGSEIYAVQVLAPEEIEPELSGDLKLIDSETHAFAEISVSHALLKRYKTNRDAFVDQVRKYCVSRGLAHFLVSSATPIEHLTLDILRKGGMLR